MNNLANIVETKNKNGIVYVTINIKTKKGIYRILPGTDQRNIQFDCCEEIKFDGFSKLPIGFYKNDGIGLTAGGFQILKTLHEHFGKKVELLIVTKGESVINARGAKVKVTLPHQELKNLNAKIRGIKQVKNEEIRFAVQSYLSRKFPKKLPSALLS